MEDAEKVPVPKKNLAEALRIIETLVVSMDRIGAIGQDVPEQEADAILLAFMSDWRVLPALSHVRRLLGEDTFSKDLEGDALLSEAEKIVEGTEVWSFSHRNPERFLAEHGLLFPHPENDADF